MHKLHAFNELLYIWLWLSWVLKPLQAQYWKASQYVWNQRWLNEFRPSIFAVGDPTFLSLSLIMQIMQRTANFSLLERLRKCMGEPGARSLIICYKISISYILEARIIFLLKLCQRFKISQSQPTPVPILYVYVTHLFIYLYISFV